MSADQAPRRDWLGYLIQSVATISAVVIAMLAWGQHIEGQLADQRVGISGLSARVDAIEAERRDEAEARRAEDAAVTLKLDTMSSSLAAIAAQLDDLRKVLKR
jgi:hypothetical protein